MRIAIFLLTLLASSAGAATSVTGELKLWHRVTVTVDGPAASEDGTPNPFRDYRLNVTFTHARSGKKHVVSGFFAADGNAAETSAKAGSKWRAHFTPDETGEWRYQVSLRGGANIALSTDAAAGSAATGDGAAGSFTVRASDKKAPDFRAKGLLQYTGEHYLRHAGNKEAFLKGGADSPENFLAYFEFDDTQDTDAEFNEGKSTTGKPFLHRYEPHARDFRAGDPTWQRGKGKNIVGALNYLASKGINSVYFLTYNIDGGDGKDVWMWTGPTVRDRYDCSKLDQWEVVFSHMDRLGIQLHVITQETENDRRLGGSPGLNDIRKLYYRELVARFGHHLAVMWNLGEENNLSDADRKAGAGWIRALDPYRHPITVHSKNDRAPDFYNGLLGDPNFEATSIQGRMENYNRDAIVLRQRSAQAGRKWAIYGDEQPSANTGIVPDSVDPEHNKPRTEALWGNLMGGGSGVEWYFGYEYPHMDLNCEDWRSRDRMWDQTRYALEFFRRYLPFPEMTPENALADGAENARVLAKAGEVYAVYLPRGGNARLSLAAGTYTVQWYNPRAGGALLNGSVRQLTGPGPQSLGTPPADPERDWAVLVKKR